MSDSPSRRWWALGALSVAMLVIGLDSTILTVAMPTLAIDLGASTSELQWISTSYTLVLAAALLPAGAVGDRFGRRRLLLGAIGLFAVASIACAFAGSAEMLITARAALGLAAAAMIPMAMAALPVLFPDHRERSRALTVWVMSMAVGLPLGPVLGGWLLENFWWGSIFLINVPLAAFAGAAVARFVPESRGDAGPIDLLGVALSSGGLLALTYGLIAAGDDGWGDPVGLCCLAAAAVLLVAFVRRQRAVASPLIDLRLFASRGFTWGTAFATTVNFAMFGLFFVVPQYFQAVLGVDALGSGLRLLPLIGGLVVGTRVAERLGRRMGTGILLATGFALLAGGLAAGATTTLGTGYGGVAAWITVVGAGMGFVLPTSMGVALDELPVERSGSGSALIQALRQAGGTIGVAVLGTVLNSAYQSALGEWDIPPFDEGVVPGVGAAAAGGRPEVLATVQAAFVHGLDVMLWASAAICGAAVIAALLVLPRRLAAPVDGPADAPAAGRGAGRGQSVHAG